MFKSRLYPDRSWESLQRVFLEMDCSDGSIMRGGVQITLEGAD